MDRYDEKARRVMEQFCGDAGCGYCDGDLKKFAKALHESAAQAFEEAALIAESEPELPGEPAPECLAAMIEVGPLKNARIAVKTTKECIAERIRAASLRSERSATEEKPR